MLQELIEQINENHSLNQPSPEDLSLWAEHPITQRFAELVELAAIDLLQDIITVSDVQIPVYKGRVLAYEHILTMIEDWQNADKESAEGDAK